MKPTVTKCDGCDLLSKDHEPGEKCKFCDGGIMCIENGHSFSVLEIGLYDNTENTCCACKAFGTAWIYCPIFDSIMKDPNIKFDETGELNGCELFKE